MFTHSSRIALVFSTATVLGSWTTHAAADEPCYAPMAIVVGTPIAYEEPPTNSWVFARSTFTNDPETGARVAQYMRKPPVEPLDDQRAVTSVYRRTRTVNRGPDGSMDTSYQVQSWGNGRGGIDAEWQMFHDVWLESFLTGDVYNQRGGNWGNPWNNGWNQSWNGGWNGGWGPGWNGGWSPGWNSGWNNGWNWGTPGWNNGWNGSWGGPGWNNNNWGGPPWKGGGPGPGWNGGQHGGGNGQHGNNGPPRN
jgi:hypothetical protein